jgi:hypothetical protein
MGKITKNKVSYDGGDVKITALGIDNLYADAIDYTTKREHQLNFGLGGRKARTWSMGNEEYSGSIDINMIDVVAIQNANKGKSLVDIEPFPIIVSFNPTSVENALAPLVTDILLAKFEDEGREVSGMNLKKKFTLFIIDIEQNVA